MASHEQMALSFGSAAAEYEAGRPDYPAPAVAWMLESAVGASAPVRVADVGAGTGKLTRALVAAGFDVVAVEPDEVMLEALRRAVPDVPTVVGSAERLALPDAALDAVVLGQAWHWVDPVRASREVGRVLRPGGVLGLVWNIRDESVGWIAEMSRIMHGSKAEIMIAAGGPEVGAPFGELETRSWNWQLPTTRAQLWHMVRSRSYVITADADQRARMERELGALFDRIGAVDDAVVELPYITHAYRTTRP